MLPLIGVQMVLAAWSRLMPAFGGEDPVAGAVPDPNDSDKFVAGTGWYHELITREAARATGTWAVSPENLTGENALLIGPTAADALAWHADYLDSYLYSPLWWFGPTSGGGWNRFLVALMQRDDLAALHFDDLTSTAQVRTVWRRILGGTVAGLVWAAEHDDVAAARHVIGCGLHSIQDFYSHSNWVDTAERRARTWFDAAMVPGTQVLPLAPWLRDRPSRTPGGRRPTLPGVADPDADRYRIIESLAGDRVKPATDKPVRVRGWINLGPPWYDGRTVWSLHTGMYELGLQHGFQSHGKFAFDCTVLANLPIGLRDAAVPILSFFGLEDLANRWRACTGDTSAPAGPPTLAGAAAPAGLLVLSPTGIALDSRWMSGISRGNRAVDDTSITGSQLFDIAVDLARRTSVQWLQELDRIGTTSLEALRPGFWHRVTTQPRISPGQPGLWAPNPPSPADIAQFEASDRQLHRLLAAGTYPPSPQETADGWWLRVTLGTAAVPNAGTDADVWLHAGGEPFLLDHGRRRSLDGSWSENRIVEWNDFEAGSRTAYVVGPFPQLPATVTLVTRSATALDIVTAAWNDLTHAVESIVEWFGDLFLTFVGGHADHVGDAVTSLSWDELMVIARQGYPRLVTLEVNNPLEVNNSTEGHYRLEADVWAYVSGDDLYCTIHWRTLRCVTESDWDRFTTDDEPFVLILATAPGTGESRKDLIGPFAGVDSGEFRSANVPPAMMTVLRGTGLILAAQFWESDDETPAQRQEMRDRFAGDYEGQVADPRSEFLDALGRALAPQWKLGDIEVFAFRRNAVVEAGTVMPRSTLNIWVVPDEPREFVLPQAVGSAIALNRT